jgi:hypothetical protein
MAYPPITYARILDDVVRASVEDNDRIYCFGKQNAEFLDGLDVPLEMLDKDPWQTPKLTDEIEQHGMVRYGANTFWHKLMILDQALYDFDEVVWIDFDMNRVKPNLPEGFWDKLSSGPTFQAALSVQRSSTHGAGWRRWRNRRWLIAEMSLWDGDPKDQLRQARLIPQCAWMYLRGRDIIKEVLEIQARFPRWMDQQVFAYWLDLHNGRNWMGSHEYVRCGYNTPSSWYYYNNLLNRCSYDQIHWLQGEYP